MRPQLGKTVFRLVLEPDMPQQQIFPSAFVEMPWQAIRFVLSQISRLFSALSTRVVSESGLSKSECEVSQRVLGMLRRYQFTSACL